MNLKFTIYLLFIPFWVNAQTAAGIEIIDSIQGKSTVVATPLSTAVRENPNSLTPFKLQQHNSNHLFLSTISELQLRNYPERGFSRDRKTVLINGIEWNSPQNNGISINDLIPLYGNTDLETSHGLAFQGAAVGGLNGCDNFIINPLNWPKSYLAAYGISNGNTRNSLRLQYRSGMLKGGWATGFSMLQKWANEGYTPGTHLHATAFLASVGKAFSDHQKLILTIFGNASQQGFSSTITRETAELSDNFKYNPNWGFQDGTKRNVQTRQAFQPAVILTYQHSVSTTNLETALSYQSGIEGASILDWFHAYNPRPDYYKNLPSFYYLQGGDFNVQTGRYLSNEWQNEPFQINWDGLFEANRVNQFSIINGRLQPALYVLSEDKSNISVFRVSERIAHAFTDNLQVTGGFQYAFSKNEYYRELKDLLGGHYFVNLNQFALQSYGQQPGWEQFDLGEPNRKVKPGEKYNYHYLAQTHKGKLWALGNYNKGKFKFWMAGVMSLLAYQRKGFYQNGVFPDDSYGVSGWQSFLNFQGKAELAFSIQSNHQIWLSVSYGSNPPAFEHTFINPRIRNATIKDIQPEKITAMEAGWQIQRKNWQASLSVYSAEIKNQTDVMQFYHDDYRTFVHLILTGVSTAQTGIEFASSVSPFNFLDLNFLATFLQAFYNSRPAITLIRDNDTTPIAGQQAVYWKNYDAVSGPQSILGLGFNFHHSKWGYLSISGSWQGRNYVAINPSRYTESAVYLLPAGNEQRARILAQEKLKDYFLIQLAAGTHFKFSKSNLKFLRKSEWYLSAGIQNLLDYRGYELYGSEQLRFDFDQKNPEIFPNKYKFGLGRTYFISLRYQGW